MNCFHRSTSKIPSASQSGRGGVGVGMGRDMGACGIGEERAVDGWEMFEEFG